MNYIEELDKLLLFDNVVDDFYNRYNSDADFKSWLDGILPEVSLCEKQEQYNPWHKYNVLGHILHSVDEMNKLTISWGVEPDDRKKLAYTMFFHDIGKPACHIRREKNGEMIDSFFNHNIESEKVFRRVADTLGFDSEDTEVISKLVYKHDIFMFIKDFSTSNPYWKRLTPELMQEEIQDLDSVGDGKKLMGYLILVGKSDNLAQNEEMTAESLAMLDKMSAMLENIDEICIDT